MKSYPQPFVLNQLQVHGLASFTRASVIREDYACLWEKTDRLFHDRWETALHCNAGPTCWLWLELCLGVTCANKSSSERGEITAASVCPLLRMQSTSQHWVFRAIINSGEWGFNNSFSMLKFITNTYLTLHTNNYNIVLIKLRLFRRFHANRESK